MNDILPILCRAKFRILEEDPYDGCDPQVAILRCGKPPGHDGKHGGRFKSPEGQQVDILWDGDGWQPEEEGG